jgi:hypothetical protein
MYLVARRPYDVVIGRRDRDEVSNDLGERSAGILLMSAALRFPTSQSPGLSTSGQPHRVSSDVVPVSLSVRQGH